LLLNTNSELHDFYCVIRLICDVTRISPLMYHLIASQIFSSISIEDLYDPSQINLHALHIFIVKEDSLYLFRSIPGKCFDYNRFRRFLVSKILYRL
jgi:hypothetical protein